MLCLSLQGGMLVWDRVTRPIKSRMALTLAGLAGVYIGMSLLSNRTPIAFIATGMTLDPWTGFIACRSGKTEWITFGLIHGPVSD